MSALVTVVTVSLNAAASIGDTLASVHGQISPFGVEHVCVDGGSTDGTRGIIDRWAADSNSIVRVYEPDHGIFDAMNKGLGRASGEYILFLNADDFLMSSDSLATAMSDVVAGRGSPDLVLGDVVMAGIGARGLWRHRQVPRVLGRVRGSGLYAYHQGMIARRELVEAVGGFDANLRLAADTTQFFDFERLPRLSIKILRSDITFMRAGGAANANLRAVRLGSAEIYRHLRAHHGVMSSGAMVLVKTMQSILETRYGTPPGERWFAAG